MFVELWKSIMWLIFIMLLYSPCSEQQNLHFFPLDDIYLEIVAGSVLNFPKCSFVSTIPNVSLTKADIFWVKGGVFRINSTNDPVAYGGNGIEQNFTFPFLQIHRSVLSDGGIYQCAVKIANQTEQPVFSDKFEVKVKAQIVEFLPTIDFEITLYSARLFNCKYNAQESLSDFSYWLFNGKDKYDASDTAENAYSKYPTRRELNNMKQFEVPPLQIKSYNMIGSYQCVIFDKNTMEREFKSDVFVIPRQPDPVFVNGPFIVEEGNIEIGRFISIHGCEFETYLNLKEGDMYWIKDGMKKIYASAYLASETYLPPYKYRFSNLNIERINYTDHGYYQCAINIVGYSIKEIRSGHVDLKLPDTSNTKLSLKLNREWTLDYLNQSSGAFIDLKNVVEKSILEVTSVVASDVLKIVPTVIVNIIELSQGSVNVISRITIANVDNSMKMQLSNVMQQKISKDSFKDFKQLKPLLVENQNLDSCPKSNFGDVNYKGEYVFDQTFADQTVRQNCTYRGKGVLQRRCVSNLKDGPVWEVPDLSQCEPKSPTTMKLIQLSEETICVNNSIKRCMLINTISKNLIETVGNGSVISNYHDVNLVAKVIGTIANVFLNATAASKQVFKDVLQTIDNLLESNATFIAKSQIETSSSTSILNSLSKFAEIYSKQVEGSISVSNKNIAFHVEKVRKGNIILSAHQLSNDSVEIGFNSITNLNKTDATYAVIQIPSEVFSNESEVIHSYFFRYDSFFMSENSLLKLAGKKFSNEQIIQSVTLSVSFGSKNVTYLRRPIILTFKKVQSLEFTGTSNCHYWDERLETGIKGVYGKWMMTGCYKYEAGINTDQFFTCACDHLTNFALLLDVNQSSENPLGLKIISLIGCGISLAGLSLTLLTLIAFRNLRKKLPQKILVCLCISLTGLLLTFLVGAEKTSPRRGCQVIAAIIHFFILSTFCWMLVEALNLYRSFVTIFKRSGDKHFLRNAGIFAWGLPAVIVINTGILKPDQLGNDKVCVIRGYPFYFGVLLPVCLILLVNFVVLVLTILSLTKRVSTGKEATLKEYYLSQARITFMCATLLGSSWLFAVLAVKDLSTVFQWLFCITTSLQGFFIFVFYILRNKEIMIEWRRCFADHKQYNVTSSSKTPKSYEMKSTTLKLKENVY